MIVGRIVKETTDENRVTVDFTPWLDIGETIGAITNPKIIQGAFGWNSNKPPLTASEVPYDPTPASIASLETVNSATQVQLFIISGTPGMAYTAQFVVWGGSGRKLTIEVGVQITGTPPVPGQASTPSGSLVGFLPLAGGTMLGPLYLFEDPQAPTEAATKSYVDNLFVTTVADVTAEAAARATADAVNLALITAETARAEAAETSIQTTLLADMNTAKVIVAGVGLNGGTVTLSGTAAVSGTFTANYQAGTLTAFGTGLTLAAGTLAPNYRAGTLSAIGAGVTLASGTLSAGGSGGTVTKLVTSGAGINGGTITGTGTLSVEWNGGTVNALGAGLSISGGTLEVSFPGEEWTAGAVSAIGTGLALSGGTLVSQSTALFTNIVDQTGSRAYGTTFTNSTGKPMYVSAGGSTTVTFSSLVFFVDGITVSVILVSDTQLYIAGIVPAGATYQINVSTGSVALDHWTETF